MNIKRKSKRVLNVFDYILYNKVTCIHCKKSYIPFDSLSLQELNINPIKVNNWCSKACYDLDGTISPLNIIEHLTDCPELKGNRNCSYPDRCCNVCNANGICLKSCDGCYEQ